ncbi:type II secretion system minor pseudopilin GspK [Brevundimonas sp.]|uniref:type II secretion system minor pseudopilin GspK n=1 Tax=Brevundimonas sp. TaxID=1871086 RepID=UPI0025DB9CC6|nr:type II secretion system minor pseudopilin GspK [Brevundimonas sp.]
MTRRPHEEGVALMTVLLLVAVMSTLAVGILDDIRFGLRRTENARNVGQAQWYALGAEALAQARIRRLWELDRDRTSLAGDWNGRPFEFPTDDGGVIRASIRDGGACFNLNSVVEGRSDLFMRRELGVEQFTALARALGLTQGQALADSLADWIDTDVYREGRGGEDEAYSSGVQPYRTGGTLLAEVSELRAIRGFTPEVYARLRPHVCALPTSDLSPINLNTLPVDRPELITMLTSGAVGPDTARQILRSRPAQGWASATDFWVLPAVARANVADAVLDQARVSTRFFALSAEVRHVDAEVVLSALLEQTPAGPVRVRARRWTYDE